MSAPSSPDHPGQPEPRLDDRMEPLNGPLGAQDHERTAEAETPGHAPSAEVTERQAVEEALRSERNFLSTLLDTMGALVVVLDTEGRIVRFNRASEQTTGYAFEEVRGRIFWDLLLTPEEAEEVKAVFARLTAGDFPNTHENSWLTKDGRQRLIAWANTALLDAEGRVELVIGTGIDVTERRLAEQALREAHEKYRVLFDSLPIGLTLTDPSGHILESNTKAERLLRLPNAVQAQRDIDASEWRIVRLDGSPMPPEEYASVRALKENRPIENVEMGIVSTTGDVVWIDVTAAPMPLEGYGVAIAYSDISVRKRIEDERNEVAHRLRERVKELNCLYGISSLAAKQGMSLEEILRGVVGLLPPSWLHPEVACARIVLDGNEFRTDTFEETGWAQSSEIVVNDRRAGSVEVRYLEERPASDEGPFQKEERALLDEIAIRLGRIAERKGTDDTLRRALEVSQRRQAEFSALLTGARAVLEQRSFQNASEIIYSACKELVGATTGYVALSSPNGQENVISFLDPGDETCTVDPNLPMPIRGLRAVAYARGQAICENRFGESEWPRLLPQGHTPLSNVLFAPLVIGGTVTGLLALGNKPGGFNDDDARLASAFAELAAIALLDSRNRESLEASLKDKEVLLREIHHRVKNNLQIVASLLNLQAEQVRDAKVLAPLKDSQDRIRSLALIHEKLYQSSDLERIDVQSYVRDIATALVTSYRGGQGTIALELAVDKIFLGANTAVPAGLIINELVSNAIKHAFPDGGNGEIGIELVPLESGGYRLTVSDNGVGLPDDLDFRNSGSLGLQLVAVLVQQLGGAIELDRTAGTRFEITFGSLA